jgi:uncharacterized surface protein with fasciclin (FAS1) repeats
MVSFDKKSRCLKTFRNLNFIQHDNQPDLEIMRVHILDCLNAILFIEAKELMDAKSIERTNGEKVEESTSHEIKKRIEESDARRQVFKMAIIMSLEYGLTMIE